jgi:hypothetical protein
MQVGPVVAIGALVCLVGCSSSVDLGAPKPPEVPHSPTAPLSAHFSVHLSVHRGSLTAHERSLATAVAKRQQHKVMGTFIGATAFGSHGTPFDPGSVCDLDKHFVNIRLVWKADANFVHSHLPDSPPDGPRKDLLMTVDPASARICEIGAGYQNVGAASSETLLYGEWPDPAAS